MILDHFKIIINFFILVDGSGNKDEEGFFTDQVKVDMEDEGNGNFDKINRRINASPTITAFSLTE